jgi:hypothetical protein
MRASYGARADRPFVAERLPAPGRFTLPRGSREEVAKSSPPPGPSFSLTAHPVPEAPHVLRQQLQAVHAEGQAPLLPAGPTRDRPATLGRGRSPSYDRRRSSNAEAVVAEAARPRWVEPSTSGLAGGNIGNAGNRPYCLGTPPSAVVPGARSNREQAGAADTPCFPGRSRCSRRSRSNTGGLVGASGSEARRPVVGERRPPRPDADDLGPALRRPRRRPRTWRTRPRPVPRRARRRSRGGRGPAGQRGSERLTPLAAAPREGTGKTAGGRSQWR